MAKRRGRSVPTERSSNARSSTLLELQDIRHKIVGTLPYGLQKRVELARALALDPTLLLLDEPTAGMNAEETEDMVRFILYVKRVRKLTVVMIEHDMGVVMDISDRVAVLDFGEKIAEGDARRGAAGPFGDQGLPG